jgi:hypothetical protein
MLDKMGLLDTFTSPIKDTVNTVTHPKSILDKLSHPKELLNGHLPGGTLNPLYGYQQTYQVAKDPGKYAKKVQHGAEGVAKGVIDEILKILGPFFLPVLLAFGGLIILPSFLRGGDSDSGGILSGNTLPLLIAAAGATFVGYEYMKKKKDE